jgi:hypothetical protein
VIDAAKNVGARAGQGLARAGSRVADTIAWINPEWEIASARPGRCRGGAVEIAKFHE